MGERPDAVEKQYPVQMVNFMLEHNRFETVRLNFMLGKPFVQIANGYCVMADNVSGKIGDAEASFTKHDCAVVLCNFRVYTDNPIMDRSVFLSFF